MPCGVLWKPRHIICSILFCARPPRGMLTPIQPDNRARCERDHKQFTMIYLVAVVVPLTLRYKSGLTIMDDSFPILAPVLRKPRTRVTVQVPTFNLRRITAKRDITRPNISSQTPGPNPVLGNTSKISPSRDFPSEIRKTKQRLPQAVISFDRSLVRRRQRTSMALQ